MVRLCFIALFMLLTVDILEADPIDLTKAIYVRINETAIIELPQVANYRREIMLPNGTYEEHIFRVCNGKNAKTCGFWESTKKKVPSGATNYNKNKKALVIKKMKDSDFGNYMTGNKKKSQYVQMFASFGK